MPLATPAADLGGAMVTTVGSLDFGAIEMTVGFDDNFSIEIISLKIIDPHFVLKKTHDFICFHII